MISLLLPTALHQNLPVSFRRITNLIRVLLVCGRRIGPAESVARLARGAGRLFSRAGGAPLDPIKPPLRWSPTIPAPRRPVRAAASGVIDIGVAARLEQQIACGQPRPPRAVARRRVRPSSDSVERKGFHPRGRCQIELNIRDDAAAG